jgi:hypothetical protein
MCARLKIHFSLECYTIRVSKSKSAFEQINPAMAKSSIPEDQRRFILTRIPSVPFLEALLLMRADMTQPWRRETLAARLYVREKVAESLLAELCAAGMAERVDTPSGETYRYRPENEALRERIDCLADLYATHLVEVTLLIHSTLDRKAQQFADAFTWRKDS